MGGEDINRDGNGQTILAEAETEGRCQVRSQLLA